MYSIIFPRPVRLYKYTVDESCTKESDVATWKQTFQVCDTSSAGHYTTENFPAWSAGAIPFSRGCCIGISPLVKVWM